MRMFGRLQARVLRGALIASLVAIASAARAEPSRESCAGATAPSGDSETAGMVFIPGGSFTMGSDSTHPEERFSHEVRVDGFWIDRHEVTNAEFAEFVKATGYVTLAERGLDPKTHPNMTGDLTAPGSVFRRPDSIAAATSPSGGNM
jgi:formylglycine-generating enzyme